MNERQVSRLGKVMNRFWAGVLEGLSREAAERGMEDTHAQTWKHKETLGGNQWGTATAVTNFSKSNCSTFISSNSNMICSVSVSIVVAEVHEDPEETQHRGIETPPPTSVLAV